MIYTVTFNPSIDYLVHVDHFKIGEVNRTNSEKILPGGKGINVSIVLNNLGIKSIPFGFIAGFTGQEIKRRIEDDFGIQTHFIKIENGYSRINFKMKSDEESEVNGNGPEINKYHLNEFYQKLDCLEVGDILVLSGSIPKCLSNDIYYRIMDYLKDKEVKVVVDATGDLLLKVLELNPFLIKPNKHELEEMFHVKLFDKKDIIIYGKKLQDMVAKNILISMAGEGAIYICENGKVYMSDAPEGIVKNSVGAGDSMVAGFIAGYMKTESYVHAFRMGVATGSASAFSEELARESEVLNLLNEVHEVEYEY